MQLEKHDKWVRGLMTDNNSYIMCMCRPKGWAIRGNATTTAVAVASCRKENDEWFSIYAEYCFCITG